MRIHKRYDSWQSQQNCDELREFYCTKLVVYYPVQKKKFSEDSLNSVKSLKSREN